jgi:uncharacterized membrane protein YbaN (DUF454 family)
MFERIAASPESNLLLAAVVCVLSQIWREERVGTRRQLIIGAIGLIGLLVGIALSEVRSVMGGVTLWSVILVSAVIWIHDDFG